MLKTILALFLLLCSTFAALADTGASSEDATTAPKILAIGDSLMSWHTLTGLSIPNVVANELEEPTANRSIGGARLLFKIPFIGDAGMQISNQIVDGDWDWVIMNGGGNDLWFGCGCSACDKKMDKLITEDGEAGEIPRVIDELREGGSKILYFGYLRSPGVDSLIDECREEGDELENRISGYAKGKKDVHFMPLADMVPDGDLSFHGLDRIHPSVKASEEIGKRVAAFIRKHDKNR